MKTLTNLYRQMRLYRSHHKGKYEEVLKFRNLVANELNRDPVGNKIEF